MTAFSLKITRSILAIVGSIIFVDCLVLFVFSKLNFGTVVPFLISVIFLVHAFFWQRIQLIIKNNALLHKSWYILWCLFFVWLISFIAFCLVLQHKINQSHHLDDIKAVIVLGSGTKAGKPSLALANRLDTSVEVIKHHPDAVYIVSGGIGFNQKLSEAHIMATYLHDTHNIELNKVHQENKSTSTEENLQYSGDILVSNHVNKTDSIAIVTNDFHTVRAKAIAKKQGFTNPIMVASPTPLSIRFNAWFREYFAFVSGWLLSEY